MPIDRSRRDVLRAGGTLVAGLAIGSGAGAVAVTADDESDDDEPVDDEPVDEDEPGGQYADLYEELIDSTVLVQVPGEEPAQQGGIGSGFVIDEEHLVTNDHVVMDEPEVDVQFGDERWRAATVEGTDVFSDLAVLRVDDLPEEASPLPFVEGTPRVGTEVVALGNPLGFDASISRGIVSGVNRSLPSPTGFSIPAAIQTDAAVNPGNSGGPLVNLDGEVVGVVFAGAGATIGFAISAELAHRVVPALIEDGEYDHPYVGVAVAPVTSDVAAAREFEEARGVLVVEVVPGSPADGVFEPASEEPGAEDVADPEDGDVIVELAGEEIPNQDALSTVLALETSPDETIEVEVLRNGDRETLEVTLGARPDVDPEQPSPGQVGPADGFGAAGN